MGGSNQANKLKSGGIKGTSIRLLAEDCPEKTKKALKEDGSIAIENAFRLVGEVAMQELMTNQNVSMSIANFEKYVDKKKLGFLNE